MCIWIILTQFQCCEKPFRESQCRYYRNQLSLQHDMTLTADLHSEPVISTHPSTWSNFVQVYSESRNVVVVMGTAESILDQSTSFYYGPRLGAKSLTHPVPLLFPVGITIHQVLAAWSEWVRSLHGLAVSTTSVRADAAGPCRHIAAYVGDWQSIPPPHPRRGGIPTFSRRRTAELCF